MSNTVVVGTKVVGGGKLVPGYVAHVQYLKEGTESPDGKQKRGNSATLEREFSVPADQKENLIKMLTTPGLLHALMPDRILPALDPADEQVFVENPFLLRQPDLKASGAEWAGQCSPCQTRKGATKIIQAWIVPSQTAYFQPDVSDEAPASES